MTVRFFDSHCHLEDPAFDGDRDEVIRRAADLGMVGAVTSPLGREEVERSLSLFSGSELVLVSAGLDPEDFSDPEEVEKLAELIEERAGEIVAVGEVGLDYRVARSTAERERQKESFSRLIRLAEDLDKPVVVHSLWSQRPALRVLDSRGATRVVLHAFGGTDADVRFAADRGWMISVATNVVRSPNVRRVALASPLDNLVLESDSPVLAPDPGRRNEPANIISSLKYVAGLKGVDPQELAEITTENSLRVYGIG